MTVNSEEIILWHRNPSERSTPKSFSFCDCLWSWVPLANFAYTLVLSALLLTIAASRFLLPVFPLFIPAHFLNFGPSTWKDPPPPFSSSSPTETRCGLYSSQTSIFFQNSWCAMFSVPCCILFPSQISVCCLFNLCVNLVSYGQYTRGRDVCVPVFLK